RDQVTWLRDRDKNTKFFHSKASQRRHRNQIRSIRDENGVWSEEEGVYKQLIINYFQTLFLSSQLKELNRILEHVESKATEEMNNMLTEAFSKIEIVVAIRQMNPTKASALDEMSAIFYQKYRGIIGDDVVRLVLLVLQGGAIPASINHWGEAGLMAIKLDISKDMIRWSGFSKKML
ncbi:hypothetical protein CFOL_v3_22069, partial [Cephalotus follicularis]